MEMKRSLLLKVGASLLAVMLMGACNNTDEENNNTDTEQTEQTDENTETQSNENK
jgi:outer membrane biogenesis lipoprotein LolB